MNAIARTFAIVILLLPLSACAISGDALEGKVLDEATNKPVPGAIVVLRWQGNNWGALVHSQGVCYHVETAITDENGQYRTPEWSDAASGFFINNRYITKNAYKPGYVFGTKPTEEKVVWMVPFKGTREERLEYLERMARSGGCDSAGESRRNLYSLYEALYYEAKANAAKEEDLQWYRRVAAKISIGVSDQLTHAESEKQIEQFLQGHLR